MSMPANKARAGGLDLLSKGQVRIQASKIKERVPDPSMWAHYVYDPVGFVEQILGAEPQEWQREELRRISDPGVRRHAIKACHGPGKTAMAAWVILWWICTRPFPRIPCTAPTENHLLDRLWPELHKWHRQSKGELWRWFEWEKSKYYLREQSEEWFAVGRVSRVHKVGVDGAEAWGMQGYHSDHLLFVVDEACFDASTEILTDSGWKTFDKLTTTDRVLVRAESGESFYEKPTAIHAAPRKGEMVHFKQRGADFMITPNHRVLYKRRGSSESVLKEIQDAHYEMFMTRSAEFSGTSDKRHAIGDGRLVGMREWAAFLGWYLSDGSIQRRNGKPYSIVITQSKQEMFSSIRAVLKGIGVDWREYHRQDVATSFVVNDVALAMHVAELGNGKQERRVPRYILNGSREVIKAFFETFSLGDGYKKDKSIVVYGSNKGLMDDVHEAATKLGYCASLCKRPLSGVQSKMKDGRIITSTKDGYVLRVSDSPTFKVTRDKLKRVEYEGMVYCVTTPTGVIFTRRNGYCFWSGNSGVDDAVFSAVEGALATDTEVKVLALGNPNVPSGWFYEAFTKNKDIWQLRTISYKDSPKVSDEWAMQMINSYGIDHPWVKIRVLGEFPGLVERGLFSMRSLMDAIERQVFHSTEIVLGVDVARYGDARTIFTTAAGGKILKIEAYSGLNVEEVALEVEYVAKEIKASYVVVDSDGVGAGVTDILRRLLAESSVKLVEWHGSSKAANSQRYSNTRSELMWLMRDALEAGRISIPDNEPLLRQASAVRYDFDNLGRIRLEKKKILAKMIGESPDELDSVSYALVPFLYHDTMPTDSLLTAEDIVF